MNFASKGLKVCVSRAAARKRRYLSTITATEKMDSKARQHITAAPNRPTFLSSSVKVIAFSYAPQPRAAPHSFWSARRWDAPFAT